MAGGTGVIGGGTSDNARPFVSLLVVQATPFCNIRCDYCYLPDRGATRRLSQQTIDRIVVLLGERPSLGPNLGIAWHAGEPLVVGVPFYADAFRRFEPLSDLDWHVTHSLQTNATLISADWCRLFRAHQVQVGVSLDGPALIHDRHRKTLAGRGTHAAVMRGVRLLQEHEIPFHVIAVVTVDALDRADAIVDFFLDNGITQVGFNVEELEGANTSSSLLGGGADIRYRSFMRRVSEASARGTRHLHIRELDRARQLIIGDDHDDGRAVLNHQVEPFEIITIDCDGGFSTFSPELLGQHGPGYSSFVFGNVHTSTFEEAAATTQFRAVAGAVRAGVERCQATCGYFSLCGGGAPANKLFERGSFDTAETMYCRLAVQTPIDIVLEELEEQLRRWNNRRSSLPVTRAPSEESR